MVAEFLRAEIDSPRFGRNYLTLLLQMNATRKELIDEPNLSNSYDNERRRQLLFGGRGYPRNGLFTDFPEAVIWQHVRLSKREVQSALYARVANWIVLSEGTRVVVDGARNMNDASIEALCSIFAMSDSGANQLKETARHVQSAARAYSRGDVFPKLIAVEFDSRIVLVEGHVRATGIVLSGVDRPTDVLLGRAPEIGRWERRLLA